MSLLWLEEYEGQTTEELLVLADSHDLLSLAEAFEMGLNQREGIRSNEDEKIVTAILDFGREVLNGGFGQFLLNFSGRFAPIIVSALERIGCPKKAAVTRAALDAVPDWKGKSIKKLSSSLANYNQEYFRLEGSGEEDLPDALIDFIRKNKHRIRLPVPEHERIHVELMSYDPP